MKFIQFTGSKESNPQYKLSTRSHHGIFECPICLKHVEKKLSEGKRNNSCGNKECRKLAGNFKGAISRRDSAITLHPYYSNIASIHSKLKLGSTPLNDKWLTLSAFFNDVIDKYSYARDSNSTRITYNIAYEAEEVNKESLSFIPFSREYTKVKHYKGNRYGKLSNVYVLHSMGKYKIGVADDVDKRVKGLLTGNPAGIDIITSVKTTSARSLEAYIHMLYKDLQHSGEWFSLTEVDVLDIIDYFNRTIDSNGIWTGDSIIVRHTTSVTKQNNKDKDARGKCIEEKYVSERLKGPTITTPLNQYNDIPPIPEEVKRVSITKHLMYSAWNGMKVRARKNKLTVSPEWLVFNNFIDDNNEYYNLESPILVLDSGESEYSKNTSRFIDRSAFSYKNQAVIGTKASKSITFNSAKEASIALGGIASHITACCKGTRKTHIGYKWQYN